MDTLDQIASLLEKEKLRREVADYFENHFRYGMNLWYWYKENLEKIPRDLLKKEFRKESIPSFKEWKKETCNNNFLDYKKERDKSEADRWYYFREWCNFEEYLWEK